MLDTDATAGDFNSGGPSPGPVDHPGCEQVVGERRSYRFILLLAMSGRRMLELVK